SHALHPRPSRACAYLSFFLLLRPSPRPTLFPYTTLFRSLARVTEAVDAEELQFLPYRAVFEAVADDAVLALDDTSARAYVSSKRSEEHTSELQSRENIVCRLLLEKKNNHRIAR